MPIYEYECAQCGQIIEAMQKISDEPLTTCTQCQGPLHKLISQSSFHLKGTGWYATDYANRNTNKAENSAKKQETGPPSAKSETKSESSGTASESK